MFTLVIDSYLHWICFKIFVDCSYVINQVVN